MTDDDKALVDELRDTDSYYRIQEKHWCIDDEELERQRLTAADRIEAQAAEIERLRAWFGKLIEVCEETSFDGVDFNHWVREEDDIEYFRAALG